MFISFEKKFKKTRACSYEKRSLYLVEFVRLCLHQQKIEEKRKTLPAKMQNIYTLG